MGKVADFREVIKGLKHQKINEKTIKICPKCHSPNIDIIASVDIYPNLSGITPEKYFCKNCGYTGTLILEKPIEENNEKEA